MIKIDRNLKNKVAEFLKSNKGIKYSIPELCEKFDIDDDFIMSSVIGELETEETALQDGKRVVYREDGGEVHLVLHSSND